MMAVRHVCSGVLAGVALMVVASLVDGAHAQSRGYYDFLDGSGAAPPALIIEARAPDTLQICISHGTGLVACRSMGELRVWVADRTPMQQRK